MADDETTGADAPQTPPAEQTEGAMTDTAPATGSAYDAALAAGNALAQAQPSGGDTATGDAGNASGSTNGAPPSMPENSEGASGNTASGPSTSEPTGDGVQLTSMAHPEGELLPEGAEPAETAIEHVEIEIADPAERAYEAARVAAVEAGDTSWPTWAFLGLDQKLKWIDEQDAAHS